MASKAIGSLYVQMAADAGPAIREMDRLKGAAAGMGGPLGGKGGEIAGELGLGGFARLARGGPLLAGAAAVGLVGAAAAKAAIDGQRLSAEYQKAAVSFKYLTGDAKAGKEALDQVRSIALDSPFDVTAIADSTKRFIGAGMSARDAVLATRALGDIAAATGVDFDRLGYAYANVLSKGKLMAEELTGQFGELGLGASFFAAQLGVSTEKLLKMVTDGKVTADMVTKVFADLTKEGGKFAGAMKEMVDVDQLGRLNKQLDETKRLFYDSLAAALGFENGLKGLNDAIGRLNAQSQQQGFGTAALQPARHMLEDMMMGFKLKEAQFWDWVGGSDIGQKRVVEEMKTLLRMRQEQTVKPADPLPQWEPKPLFKIPPEVREFIEKAQKEYKELNLAPVGREKPFVDQGFGEYSKFRRESELARRGLIANFHPGEGIDGRAYDHLMGSAFLELEKSSRRQVDAPRAIEVDSQEGHAMVARMGESAHLNQSATDRVRQVLEQMKALEERQAADLKRLADAVMRSDIKPIKLR